MQRSRAIGKLPWFVTLQELQLLIILGKLDEAHNLLPQWVSDIPEDYLCCWSTYMIKTVGDAYNFAGLLEMLMGHNDHAAELLDRSIALPRDRQYEHDINNWFGPPQELLDWGYLPALNRAQLYIAAGEIEKGNELLKQCDNYLENVALLE